MLVLGLQGSPRKKGNTHSLLSAFLDEAENLGAATRLLDVPRMDVQPCRELIVCEKKGYCPIDDDMKREVYGLLRQADIVVMASPIFFYNVTAQLKALIDRSQTLWARKYRLHLVDPGDKVRKGFVLSVAATRGKHLFEGLKLTAQYFFDAVGAEDCGGLTYRGIENLGDMQNHPTFRQDVQREVGILLGPLVSRKKVLFAGRTNTCRSQMAAAFARYHAGDKLDVDTGGIRAADKPDPNMTAAMHEKGIDMAFRVPRPIRDCIDRNNPPEIVVTMDGEDPDPGIFSGQRLDWGLPEAAGQSIEFIRTLRDEIEAKVKDLIRDIT